MGKPRTGLVELVFHRVQLFQGWTQEHENEVGFLADDGVQRDAALSPTFVRLPKLRVKFEFFECGLTLFFAPAFQACQSMLRKSCRTYQPSSVSNASFWPSGWSTTFT